MLTPIEQCANNTFSTYIKFTKVKINWYIYSMCGIYASKLCWCKCWQDEAQWLPNGFLARMAVLVSTGWPGPNLFWAFTRNLYFLPGSRSFTTWSFFVLGIVPGTFSQTSVPSSHFSTTYPTKTRHLNNVKPPCWWTRGVQVKLWDPLKTRAIPERLRGAFTTRRYTNPRLPYLYLL